jgi:non-ribosomal peptide synthetase component F
MSYRELNARANRLARRLRAAGVSQGVRVGVFLERSLEIWVSLLAVLKAGGTYLPLDPKYPPERLSFMPPTPRYRCHTIALWCRASGTATNSSSTPSGRARKESDGSDVCPQPDDVST